MTWRDLYLGVRAQNLAGGVIRGVGRDLSMQMRQVQALSRQRVASGLAVKNAQMAKQRVSDELLSMQTGTKHLRIEEMRRKVTKATSDLSTKYIAAENAALANRNKALAAVQAQEAKIASLGTAKGARAKAALALQNDILLKSQAELVAAENAFTSAQEKAALATGNLNAAQRRLIATENEHVASISRTNAKLTAETERVALLTDAYNALGVQMKQAAGREMMIAKARTAEHLGRTGLIAGAAGTLFAGIAARQAADFETQLTLAATQARPVGAGMGVTRNIQAKLSKQIQDMMTTGTVTAPIEEQTRSAYEIFSGLTLKGKDWQAQVKNGMGLLKQFNQVAKANYGLVDLNEVTEAGIVLINNFDTSMKNVPKNLNTMQAAVRFGKMDMAEFIGTLNQAAPAARSAGYTFTGMASSIAFLSRKFPSIRMAATGYARLTEILANKKSVEGLKRLGIQAVNSHGQMLPLDVLIGNIVKKFPDLAKGGVALQNFFKDISNQTGTVQARRAFTAFVQDMRGYRNILGSIKRDRKELQLAAQAAQESPAVRWAELTQQLKMLLIVIGEGAIPAFAKLGEYVRRLVDWWRSLSDSTQHSIGYFLVFISVATLVGGLLLTIVGGLTAFVLGLSLVGGEFSLTGAAAAKGVKDMATLTEEAAVGSAALRKLGDEAGFVRVGLTRGLGITGVVSAMILWHRQIFQIISDLGGLNTIVAALAGYSLIKLVGTFRALTLSMITAETWALRLRAALLLIPTALTIVVTVLMFKKEIKEGMKDFIHFAQDQGIKARNAIREPVQNAVQGFADRIGLGFMGPGHTYDLATHKQIAQAKKQVATLKKFYGKEFADFNKMGPLQFYKTSEQQVKNIGEFYDRYYGNLSKQQRAQVRAFHNAPNPFTDTSGVTSPDVMDRKWENFQRKAKKRAKDLGVAATPQFKELYQRALTAVAKAKAADNKNIALNLAAMKAVDALKASTDAQHYKAAMKAINAETKGAEDVANTMEQAADAYASKIDQATSALEGVFNTLLSQSKEAYGTLFQFEGRTPLEKAQRDIMQTKIDWGIPLNAKDLITNLDTQNKYFTQFRSDITKLAGVLPHDMLAALQAQGEAGMPFMEALINATPAQRKDIIAKWKRGQHAIQVAARQDFNREMKYWKALGKGIVDNMLKGMDEQSAKIHDWVKELATSMLADIGVTLASTKAEIDAKDKGAANAGKTGAKTGQGGGKGGTVTQNIYGVPAEDLKNPGNQARWAWHLRHRLF